MIFYGISLDIQVTGRERRVYEKCFLCVGKKRCGLWASKVSGVVSWLVCVVGHGGVWHRWPNWVADWVDLWS